MKKEIWPSAVSGIIGAPPSKSSAQRAIAMASLAKGRSVVQQPGRCCDVLSAIEVCKNMGASISWKGDDLEISGGIHNPKSLWHCGESGLGIRMFSAIAAATGKKIQLTGEKSLVSRPMGSVEESLRALGVDCQTIDGKLPITVQGPFKKTMADIDGSLGSQVLTGILVGAPLNQQSLQLNVVHPKSTPYIDLTIKIMRHFGVEATHQNHRHYIIAAPQQYKAATYRVEGDWSGAAFLLVAGAIAGSVQVRGLDPESAQADKTILDALNACGARTTQNKEVFQVEKQHLRAFEFDATHCPDLFPPLAILASNCSGTSRLTGVDRLRSKESDRGATIHALLTALQIPVSIEGNVMAITGGKAKAARVNSFGDHRIAMAAAIAGLKADGAIVIEGGEAVTKSYPDFFEELKKITLP